MFRIRLLLWPVVLNALLAVAVTGAFAQNLPDIKASIKAKGQKWIADETSVSNLSDDEKRMHLGLMKHLKTGKEEVLSLQAPDTGLSSSLDLVSFVTPVRNQGSCGSCWAFATTAALESQLLMRDNTPLTDNDRAEQILLSCGGAGSCSGGYIESASNYIKSTGLPTESYFPYSATDTSCSNALGGWPNDARTIGSWSYVNTSPANLNAIKSALATYGPLVTTMDVYNDFFSYAGGIYEYTGGSYAGGHAILIVGYTDDATVNGGGYFKVKNSWGTGWGSGGYFLIAYSQLGSPVYFGEWTLAYSIPNLPSVPAAPGTLTATSISSGHVNLSWLDGSSDENGFKIESCTGAGCTNFVQIATVGANILVYSNTGLTGSTTYTYRLRSYNSGGNSSYSNKAEATTPIVQAPAAPGSLTATAASSSQVNLKWVDKATNENGFRIERCEGSPCGAYSQIATVGAGVVSYNNAGLKANTNYTFRVKAYVTGADSDYSNPASATTPCSCTISPAGKNFAAAGGSATVTVTAPAGCTWSVNSNATWLTIKSQSSNSFSYGVAKNTGARRTGTFSVSGQTFTVTQSQGKK